MLYHLRTLISCSDCPAQVSLYYSLERDMDSERLHRNFSGKNISQKFRSKLTQLLDRYQVTPLNLFNCAPNSARIRFIFTLHINAKPNNK